MPSEKEKTKAQPDRASDKLVYKILGALLLALLVVVAFKYSIITISSGHCGVLWQRLFKGTRVDRYYDEGLHIIFPWDKMIIYDVRAQTVKGSITVLASTGLPIEIETVAYFRINKQELPQIHKEIGPDYAEKVVAPMTKAIVRTIVGQLSEEEVFSSQKALANRLNLMATVEFAKNHLELLDVYLVKISLPKRLTDAIEKKLTEKELIMTKTFSVEAEKQEFLRKGIEAHGVKLYNNTIAQSLSPDILTWNGIEATKKLSESQNSKIVIIGSGPKGLPLILNEQQQPAKP